MHYKGWVSKKVGNLGFHPNIGQIATCLQMLPNDPKHVLHILVNYLCAP